MKIPLSITTSRPRVRRRRKRGSIPPLPLAVTGVLGVYVTASALELSLSVDTGSADPVSVTGADGTKWTAYYDGSRYAGTSVEATDTNAFSVYFAWAADATEPQRAIYAADPSDIGTGSGRKLGACEIVLV